MCCATGQSDGRRLKSSLGARHAETLNRYADCVFEADSGVVAAVLGGTVRLWIGSMRPRTDATTPVSLAAQWRGTSHGVEGSRSNSKVRRSDWLAPPWVPTHPARHRDLVRPLYPVLRAPAPPSEP
jgi:hypothetical protein